MSNAQSLIADNLNVWTTAVQKKSSSGRGTSKKNNLYGIQKLRELILELAVRGKLVPQDPNDEPASVLLEQIDAEKEQLVKEGKIKKQKTLSPISNDEKAFELPQGWEWARFQDIATYIQRGKGPKYDDMGQVRVVSQKCVQWSGFNLDVARFVNDKSLDTYQEERFLRSKDLLWNSTGTGTVGRINVLDYVPEKGLVADSHVTVIRPSNMDSNFIWSYIAAPGIQRRIEPTHENSLVSGTTDQVELNTTTVAYLAMPVPPLPEQQRIVAKVDELMALCDQLKASLNNAQSIQTHLADAIVEQAMA
jgi:type I restriction enzyme, S subunit